MRVASTSASARREPQQERAAQRRAKLLGAAEGLIGELGYEGVTMTAIAEQAGASIGTLYDYFPDKLALAVALKTEYVEMGDAHWKALLRDAERMTREELAELFVDGALQLVKELPAYLALMGSQVPYVRSVSLRRPLRKAIAGALRTKNSKLDEERALTYAEMIVQLIKAMLTMYRESAAKERETVAVEFKKLLRMYLVEALG